ncbi:MULTISPECIES: hypothetical protein [Streptomyces]|uniref:Uncharacterized protein n=1 Tax=Streptomyces mordarskii TaxID=1226758 RepID=A0ABN1DZA6_9ACTN
MTVQPETQPPATGPASTGGAPGPADVARALDERIVGSVDVLYAHITAATLEAIGRPRLLPTALFPDADPEVVEQVWQMAFMVGFLGGKRTAESRRWEHERLTAARDQLADAGFVAMAERIARILPPPVEHPADAEALVVLAPVRGGRS